MKRKNIKERRQSSVRDQMQTWKIFGSFGSLCQMNNTVRQRQVSKWPIRSGPVLPPCTQNTHKGSVHSRLDAGPQWDAPAPLLKGTVVISDSSPTNHYANELFLWLSCKIFKEILALYRKEKCYSCMFIIIGKNSHVMYQVPKQNYD